LKRVNNLEVKMKKLCALLLGVGILSGCASTRFILVEQTAQSPSFTVIPFDGDSDFSRKVEREILALYLIVLERPELRYISTDALQTESEMTGASAMTSSVSAVRIGKEKSIQAPYYIVDMVATYPHSTADYIVVTYSYANEIRIIRRSDLVLIASGEYAYRQLSEMSKFVESVFVNANLANPKATEKVCKVTSKTPRFER
jgi:hypothetical protein